MIGKALAGLTALVALGAAATVAVVAAAFALYSVLVPSLTEAGAAAIVAGVFALVVAFGVLLAASKTGGSHHDHPPSHGGEADFDFVGKIFEIAREKPLWAAGAAVAAGLLAVRNPALVATIVAAFMDRPKSRP